MASWDKQYIKQKIQHKHAMQTELPMIQQNFRRDFRDDFVAPTFHGELTQLYRICA